MATAEAHDGQLEFAAEPSLAEHEHTYHAFVRGVFLFATHVAVILILLALFFV